MQRKNDDLKSKFDHLESAVGVFDDFGVDTEDMVMLNGIDKKKPAPRMFCDICEYSTLEYLINGKKLFAPIK